MLAIHISGTTTLIGPRNLSKQSMRLTTASHSIPAISSRDIRVALTFQVASPPLTLHGISPSTQTRLMYASPTISFDLHNIAPQLQFAKASKLTGEEFFGKLDYYANAWLPARDLLISSISSSRRVDSSGKILVFEQFLPWKVTYLVVSTPGHGHDCGHFRSISSSLRQNL